ncbi:hypothetical protein AMTRI_Chr01g108410 [Amborella trichopoda]|uniref:Carboxymethylenebutenolidase homolog n=1 Tax=Amborella trichopoda TaxID=13333 RepID=W1NY77_AMBTC|nr:carboxymethylenebutenolidase homolog [Amborella trichopoda]ERN00319.1 hypothetical protein AMTR_s00107p00150560 [Amborella trichopoda]|eukprot:XP_006837465.1 carboxymethylenebutenolidase homolog [Amborella trichopoda]
MAGHIKYLPPPPSPPLSFAPLSTEMALLSPFNNLLHLTTARDPPLSSFFYSLPVNLSLPSISSRLYCTPPLSFKTNSTSNVSQNQVKSEALEDDACELVSGVELLLGEGTNSFSAYLLKAVKNNNGMGVLLLTDVFGFEDSSTRDFAYRVSCSGYNVLVPDLFRGDPWSKDRPKEEFEIWRVTHSLDRVAMDITTSTKWMMDEFSAAGISEKLGIIGFCFGGGRLLETLARDENGYFSTAICFYGTRLDPSLAYNIKIPVFFVVGEKDTLCPVETLREMEKRINGSRVVAYSGRGHAFAHRPASPEEDEDAEDAFVIMRNWLHEGLVLKRN